jgi:hypothetical protein
MKKFLQLIIAFFTLLIITNTQSQEQLQHKKKTFRDADGKLYINKDLPVYLWLSTDPKGEKHQLKSEETPDYTNPMYFDTEGRNTIRSPWCVDQETKKTAIPQHDIVFEVYADSRPPLTEFEYNTQNTYLSKGVIYSKPGFEFKLKANDALSGVEKLYYSLDGKAFQEYSSPITFNNEKQYTIKYYAVDRVGNPENIKIKKVEIDKSSPETSHQVEGDFHDDILSLRSEIKLAANDAASGVSSIHYKINDQYERNYSSPVKMWGLDEGDHKITYYAKDNLGNIEKANTYKFFIDKTPPKILEEIIGNNFVSGGVQYASGRSQLKLTAIDNKAGVKEIKYSINGRAYMVYSKPIYLSDNKGSLSVKTYAVDNVNNKNYKKKMDTKGNVPYIDLTGPDLSHSFIGNKFHTNDTMFINKDTKITLKAYDKEAGANRITYNIDNGNEKDYKEPFQIKKEGFHEVEFTGYDNVDNTNNKEFGVFVDNKGPEIFTRFSVLSRKKKKVDNEELDVYPSHVMLFLSATDTYVGNEKIYYSINGGPFKKFYRFIEDFSSGKKYTVGIKAYDQLQNKREDKINFYIKN